MLDRRSFSKALLATSGALIAAPTLALQEHTQPERVAPQILIFSEGSIHVIKDHFAASGPDGTLLPNFPDRDRLIERFRGKTVEVYEIWDAGPDDERTTSFYYHDVTIEALGSLPFSVYLKGTRYNPEDMVVFFKHYPGALRSRQIYRDKSLPIGRDLYTKIGNRRFNLDPTWPNQCLAFCEVKA